MNTTSSIRAPRSSLSVGVKSGCEEEIARRESPLLKLLLIEKHDSQIWYWRKESNLHHALIWGLRLIRPLHYHCATPAWRFGVKDEGGRMKPAVASASFHPSSLILHPLVWSGRRDSNSRSEFGRLTCFQLHHFRVLEPPIGLEPTPNSFEANRSSIKLRGRRRNFELRISEFGFAICLRGRPNPQFAIRNPKFVIGASYRIRTGVSAKATPCLEPTGPTMQKNVELRISEFGFENPQLRGAQNPQFAIRNPKFVLVGEDRIELSP